MLGEVAASRGKAATISRPPYPIPVHAVEEVEVAALRGRAASVTHPPYRNPVLPAQENEVAGVRHFLKAAHAATGKAESQLAQAVIALSAAEAKASQVQLRFDPDPPGRHRATSSSQLCCSCLPSSAGARVSSLSTITLWLQQC